MNRRGVRAPQMGLDEILDAREARTDDAGDDVRGLSLAGNAVQIPITQLVPDPLNSRPYDQIDKKELKNLQKSLEVHGQLQPVRVRPMPGKGNQGRYFVTAGQRRYYAARNLGWESLSCVISTLSSDTPREKARTRITSLVENLQREDLHPIQVSRILLQIQDEVPEVNQRELAEMVAKDYDYVRDVIHLSEKLHPAVVAESERPNSPVGSMRVLRWLKARDHMEQLDYASWMVGKDLRRDSAPLTDPDTGGEWKCWSFDDCKQHYEDKIARQQAVREEFAKQRPKPPKRQREAPSRPEGDTVWGGGESAAALPALDPNAPPVERAFPEAGNGLTVPAFPPGPVAPGTDMTAARREFLRQREIGRTGQDFTSRQFVRRQVDPITAGLEAKKVLEQEREELDPDAVEFYEDLVQKLPENLRGLAYQDAVTAYELMKAEEEPAGAGAPREGETPAGTEPAAAPAAGATLNQHVVVQGIAGHGKSHTAAQLGAGIELDASRGGVANAAPVLGQMARELERMGEQLYAVAQPWFREQELDPERLTQSEREEVEQVYHKAYLFFQYASKLRQPVKDFRERKDAGTSPAAR